MDLDNISEIILVTDKDKCNIFNRIQNKTMKQILYKYKKRAFLLLVVCTATFILHNELTHQYDLKFPLLGHGRTKLLSPKSSNTLLQNLHKDVSNHTEVIQKRSLSFTDLAKEDNSSKDSSFEHWVQYNPKVLATFVFSAVSSNDSIPKGFKQLIKLNVWEARKNRNSAVKCCFTWNSNKTTYLLNPNKTYHQKIRIGLSAAQVRCPIRGGVKDVTGVTVQFQKYSCPVKKELYVKPITVMKQKEGSFALCGKIFYGNVDVKLIVDWIEYYRELKVDKIMIYTYNLTQKAEEVLQYYARTGYVETGIFDFPWKTGERNVGTKNPAAWTDEQVVVYDCFERLKGYTYFSIVDLDEFILPYRHKDLKSMVAYLRKVHPDAAGFTFKSHLFIKDWGRTVRNGGSDIVQYYKRTGAVFTREKNILMPDKIVPSSIHTHRFDGLEGYQRFLVEPSVATLNHYRNCYENFYYRCTHTKRFMDKRILKVVTRIKHRTSAVLKKLNLS